MAAKAAAIDTFALSTDLATKAALDARDVQQVNDKVAPYYKLGSRKVSVRALDNVSVAGGAAVQGLVDLGDPHLTLAQRGLRMGVQGLITQADISSGAVIEFLGLGGLGLSA